MQGDFDCYKPGIHPKFRDGLHFVDQALIYRAYARKILIQTFSFFSFLSDSSGKKSAVFFFFFANQTTMFFFFFSSRRANQTKFLFAGHKSAKAELCTSVPTRLCTSGRSVALFHTDSL